MNGYGGSRLPAFASPSYGVSQSRDSQPAPQGQYYQSVILGNRPPQSPPPSRTTRATSSSRAIAGSPYQPTPRKFQTPRSLRQSQSTTSKIPTESLFEDSTVSARPRAVIPFVPTVSTAESSYQGDQENLKPYDASDSWADAAGDDTVVTIFGFPLDSVSAVLQYFDHYSEISEHWMGPNGSNWMHVRFHDKLNAEMALSRSGRMVGNIMIGVKRYDPKADTARGKQTFVSTRATLPSTGASARDPYRVYAAAQQPGPQQQQGLMGVVGSLLGW